MPLLAALLVNIGAALVSVFAKFMGTTAALKLASYTLYIGIVTTFVATTYVCVGGLLSSLQSFLSGGGGGGGATGSIVSYFIMAVGMFIPGNAAGVLSCVGSVWIACNVYRLQSIGIIKFS